MTAAFTAGAVLTATNLNNAVNTQTINAQTSAGYTLVLADGGKLVTLSNASAQNLTIPLNSSVAYPTGTVIQALNIGSGTWTVTATGGVTLSGTTAIPTNGRVLLTKTGTDTWWSSAMDTAVSSGVKQVKTYTGTSAFSTSSTSYVDWTGISVSITPSSSANKVLVLVNVAAQTTAAGVALYVGAVRTSTTIAETYVTSPGNGYLGALTIAFLDSPATTSATTYKLQAKTGNGTYAFASIAGLASTLTVMEVAP